MFKTIITLVVGLVALGTFAQNVEFDKSNFKEDKDGFKNAKENLKEGDGYYSQGPGFYKNAIAPYEKAQAFNPNNAELNFRLGECYLSSTTKEKAKDVLERALRLNASINPKVHYLLGQAYHLEMNWDKAIAEFSIFQKSAMSNNDQYLMQDVRMRIDQCYHGKDLVKSPIRVFVDNLGDKVNTKYNEYGAVISADESVMIFTARRPNSTGGKIDPDINENFEDVYMSTKQEDGGWSKSVNIGEPVNTSNHDSNSGLSADGQKLLVYIGKSGYGDIFESNLEGDKWAKPESLGKNINTKDYHESSACYSPDGNTLYFVSNKPEGLGDHDIYMSTKDEKGKWGPSKNLGPTINTKYSEEGVYMHPDGKTLYFSSQGHESMGGFDIFKSVFDEKTESWSKPKNIGYPVNTTEDDVFFVISANGRHGYYTSSDNGYGLRDLIMVTFLGEEKPVILNNEDNLLASITAPVKETVVAPVVEVNEAQLTILKGVITDALTNRVLEADIEIVDNSKSVVIAMFKSNSSTGKYLVSLPAGKNYGIAVKKEGYLFHSENFDIPAAAAFQEVNKDVELKNLAVGSKIVLKNIFFDTDKASLRDESTAELNRLIKLLNDVPTLNIELSGHTDSQGTETYNQVLSEKRAKAVVNYLTNAGVSKERLKSAGYGEMQPISTNETKEGRQLNRRTEFKVLSL
ncbi:MAG: OmpA family protein [Crocinitomicaceae bacterium]|nr:OmpA family protein [Crocinitomicaceae bacterium]